MTYEEKVKDHETFYHQTKPQPSEYGTIEEYEKALRKWAIDYAKNKPKK